MSRTIIIYALIDPLTEMVRYIGKTKASLNQRYGGHLCEARNSGRDKKNTRKNKWIKSLAKQGRKPAIELLDRVPEQQWQFWEQWYICLYRSWGFRLCNLTAGGDGLTNASDETKEKLSGITKKWWEENDVEIVQLDLEGKVINIFPNIRSAAKKYKRNVSTICEALAKRNHTCAGFIWEYKSDYDKIGVNYQPVFNILRILDEDTKQLIAKLAPTHNSRDIAKIIGFMESNVRAFANKNNILCNGERYKFNLKLNQALIFLNEGFSMESACDKSKITTASFYKHSGIKSHVEFKEFKKTGLLNKTVLSYIEANKHKLLNTKTPTP